MMIDIERFTPWPSLTGGLLIGVATAMFLLFNGRIAGISGILGGLLRPAAGDIAWRIAFVLGLAGAPFVYGLTARLPTVHVDADMPTLVVKVMGFLELAGKWPSLGGFSKSRTAISGSSMMMIEHG